MNNDCNHRMTPFDEYIADQSLQMTKLIIPFLPPGSQRMIAVYVKFMEFRHTFSIFESMKQSIVSPDDIFDTVKPFLSPEDLESFEQMSNMMNMMSMMQEMQNMSDSDFDPMSMMSNLFAQDDSMDPQEEGDEDE